MGELHPRNGIAKTNRYSYDNRWMGRILERCGKISASLTTLKTKPYEKEYLYHPGECPGSGRLQF
jgi:hypothetical protein